MYSSDGTELKNEIERVIRNIQDNREFLKTVDRNELIGWLYAVFYNAAVTTKHASFDEEKEWRLCHFPSVAPSPHVLSEIETLGGVPQAIYKIKFENKPALGIDKIELNQLIDRIIIGPSQYKEQIGEAFSSALASIGVDEPNRKVYVSDIPIRG